MWWRCSWSPPWWRRWPGWPGAPPVPLVLVEVNWLLQVVDVALGSRLQLNTPFGYSPIVAGRFQGSATWPSHPRRGALVVATGPLGLRQRVWPADAVGDVTPRSYLGWAAGT